MEKEISIFGLPRIKNPFSEYIGDYALINSKGGVYLGSGKVFGIDNEILILNPFSGFTEGRYCILEKNKKITLDSIGTIEPKTLKDLEWACDKLNERSETPVKKSNNLLTSLIKFLRL